MIDLREAVVGEERKVLCAMIHSSQAVELVKNKVKNIRLEVFQKEYDGQSHNVVAELPGKRDEFIVLTAHYDTTSLSHGAYDNMSGCAGLLGIMEQLKGKELNYGLRLVFCGSEERGLLGSKAYVRDRSTSLIISFTLKGIISASISLTFSQSLLCSITPFQCMRWCFGTSVLDMGPHK